MYTSATYTHTATARVRRICAMGFGIYSHSKHVCYSSATYARVACVVLAVGWLRIAHASVRAFAIALIGDTSERV